MTYVPRAVVEAELVLQRMLHDKNGQSEPPMTNAQIGELMRQYHADPHVLSDQPRELGLPPRDRRGAGARGRVDGVTEVLAW